MRAGGKAGDVIWMLGGLLVILAAHGLAGMYGAYWRENSMNARGYTFVATVTADSMDTAIQRAMREERTPTADERDSSSIARRAAIVPEPLSPGMTGTRFEMDFDRLRDPGAAEPSATDAPPAAGATDGDGSEVPAPAVGSYRAPREDYRAVVEDEPPSRRLAWIAALAVVVVGALGAGAWYYIGHRSKVADLQATDDAEAGTPATVAQPQPTPTPVPIPVPTPVATPASPGTAAAAGAAAADDGDPGGGEPAATRARPLSPAEIEAAWARHYKPAAKCIEPVDWDTYVECVNTMMREREAFAARLTKSPDGTGTPAGKGP